MDTKMPVDLHDAVARFGSKSLSPQELVEACLQRAANLESRLHGFLYLDAEGARAAARNYDPALPLAGIPVAFKDLFDVAGQPTTGNSRVFEGRTATQDAPSVAALRAAGAIVLGKLACWECGMGGTSFTLPLPPVRNPWRLERDPGGSSTGSAATIAAGICLGSLGTDTGGSIREPAAWCGIAGLKPTYGAVAASGVMAASFTLDHVGPLARSSRDCALLFDVLVGRDACARSIDEGVAGVRVGVVDLSCESNLMLAPDIAEAVERVAQGLAKQGAELKRVRLPPLSQFSSVCTVLAGAEGLAIHRETVDLLADRYDRLTLQRLLAGRLISGADYVAADVLRRQLMTTIMNVFAEVDLLLMPTTARTAPLLGAFDSHGGHISLCRPWNVTGLPALSVRAGFDRDDLPIGLQIIARPRQEALALRAGHAVEAQFDDRARWPDVEALPVPAPMPPSPSSEARELPAELSNLMAAAAEEVRRSILPGGGPASRFTPIE
jgi:aspartyl-tRNA(Asn)/glutamyl-tRNA(Gln) amidotransferase subunit A